MNFFNRLRETLTHLDNALDNAAHPQAGRPVFAVIDTETTGFNKRYDRIIELAAVRADAYFNPSTPGTHCSTLTPTPCPLLGGTPAHLGTQPCCGGYS